MTELTHCRYPGQIATLTWVNASQRHPILIGNRGFAKKQYLIRKLLVLKATRNGSLAIVFDLLSLGYPLLSKCHIYIREGIKALVFNSKYNG